MDLTYAKALEFVGGSQAQMVVGPATGKGSKKTYPVYVLWLCAKKGGNLQLNTPTDTVLAAEELLTTYSYSPATGHTALLGHASVHGQVWVSRRVQSQVRALFA
jgi:hypothetical protein